MVEVVAVAPVAAAEVEAMRFRDGYVSLFLSLAGLFANLTASSILLTLFLPQPEVYAGSGESGRCEAWHRPDGYDESWLPESFRSVCQVHKACYEKSDASWSACNSEFYSSLRQACENSYPHASLSAANSRSDTDEASAESSLLTCLQVADEFYAKVQASPALKQFQAMQEKASKNRLSAL
ncbi:MAG: hypothetical protein RIQ81_198 [Pseudomonadota bacterium]